MKKVLVIYYSQSGQLYEIAKNVMHDFHESDQVALSYYEIKLKNNFPFPWNKPQFFDAFPESFAQIPSELEDLENPILTENYDLIILAYQVWYLTPSIPINSFLKNPIAEKLLQNTPVVTLIGCRNMWIMAQEKVKTLLQNNKAQLVGNIVLTDKHLNHISVITIVQWMFTGVKKKYLGIFPKPGVSEQDISESSTFSPILLSATLKAEYTHLQEKLLEKSAVTIKPFLILTDQKANKMFKIWSDKILTKTGKTRTKWLKFFNYYLIFAIWVISPIVFILYLVTYPYNCKKINAAKEKYSQINLN